MAETGNGVVQFFIEQSLLSKSILQRHRGLAALLDAAIKRDRDSRGKAKTPIEIAFLAGANRFLVCDSAPAVVRDAIWNWIALLVKGPLEVDRVVDGFEVDRLVRLLIRKAIGDKRGEVKCRPHARR